MSNFNINPAWLRWTNLENEGGEGFNPHPKWIAKVVAPIVTVNTSVDNRMLRDERGNLIPASKLANRLQNDTKRLSSVTDAYAQEILQASIDFARQQLDA